MEQPEPGGRPGKGPVRTDRQSLAGAGHDPQAWRLAPLPRYVQQQAEGQELFSEGCIPSLARPAVAVAAQEP